MVLQRAEGVLKMVVEELKEEVTARDLKAFVNLALEVFSQLEEVDPSWTQMT